MNNNKTTKDEKPNLSESTAENLPTPATGNKVYYFAGDKIQNKKAPRGFGVRVTKSGAKSFIMNYRIAGRERRYTIGAWPDWKVIAAVDEARKLRKRIDRGDDPLEDRVEAREAPTVGDLCDLYIEDHLPSKRKSSQSDDKGMIKNIIRPKFGRKKVKSIQKADIKNLHRSLKDTPYKANRVLALLSTMFNFAINDLEWSVENKVRGVKRFPEIKRKRYLDPVDEIPRLVQALTDFPDICAAKEAKRRGKNVDAKTVEKARQHGLIVANAVRLCLLTGCRRGEALGATWDQFDIENGSWTKPGATTKQGTEHRVRLSDAAVALLKDILASAPKTEDGVPISEFVSPNRSGNAPLTEINDEWAALQKAAKIPDVRLHDLRHTYASILVSEGLSLPIIGALLGHTNPATTARYAHVFDDPLKKATDIVGHIVTGKKPAKLEKLHKDGAA